MSDVDVAENTGKGRRRRRVCAALIGTLLLTCAAYIGIKSDRNVINKTVKEVVAKNAKGRANETVKDGPHRVPEFVPPSNGPQLDFYIAGFPKCSTSTLKSTLSLSNEISIWPKERCDLNSNEPDAVVYDKLTSVLNNTNLIQGIKCPTGICCSQNAVRRLEKWYPNVKLIFGLRHPIAYFQSFYNYRAFSQSQSYPIPPAETLVGDNHYFGAGTISAKFERYLIRLRRVNTTNDWLPFDVLLYHMEQIRDDHDSGLLRETIKSFLGLKEPVPPFLHTNARRSFDGMIDICDSKYDAVRQELIANGNETQRWIREEFMKNPRVVVENEKHFYSLMEMWSIDPCTNKSAR